MFDDVIDHSYDKEISMFRREEMIANQLEKLCTKSIEHWNQYMERHAERLIHNSRMLLVNSRNAHNKILKILRVMEQKS